MARKKRTIVEETLPDGISEDPEGTISDFDVALESVDDTEKLRNVLEEHGQTGASFKIYRQTATGEEFCFQTDHIDEEFIQKNYGGGDFRVRVFINGKYRIPIKVKIAPRIVENGNGNGHHTNGDSRHSEFLEKMLLTLLARESPSAGPSINDLTSALANLDSLRGKQESTMDLFLKGVTFAKETMNDNRGTGDWKTEAISAVKDAIPMLGNLIPGRNPNPIKAANPNELVNATPDQQVLALKSGIDYLKKQCLKNVDPDLIIEWVVNNSEDYQPLIHVVLNLPFEKFVEIDAQIGNEPFKSWFTGLFNGLRSSFKPDDSVELDSTGEHGSNPNAGDNGDVSANKKSKSK